ncbi:LegC family aminotransferase [Brevibacillus porteri]|uniref:Aminotransferase DegT n=1 Tax=Brevibacillus porteri TaxID=2126350 RepID=A0ABX5FMU7_9BACL|nr:LegC family aminotransferase [Brevibacillus porteri]MED1801452.1 LegC family aminotransferase [Brevibacillus porteri]MED2133845.1 LegC family aminotransferase [Brevibacillus porteri]MED2748251.1 LegC family aminotransferase [Brevibacillus porteri]MED2815389.1 LegC family aminotransferase [Brevibacillus porteri]MED2894804.1 LegC family aminotransferase [Brevibacillus porteri]
MKQPLRTESIISILKDFKPKDMSFLALHEPSFQGNEWVYVKECLDSGWVSSVGKYVDKFEQMLQEYTGMKRAVAVMNGTAALHVSLLLVGVEPEDEILIPTLTFIATANAVAYCGAIPHFVDCHEETLGLDPRKLELYLQEIAEVRPEGCFNKQTGKRIKAVVPMHTFGHPVDLDYLLEVCVKYRLELVEDAAESLGSFYKGKHTGHWGKVSALSFNGNKVVTTGGGGAILTNDEELGRLAKHLTTTAKKPHKWAFEHDQIGYNYRMPNINAALGCAQLEMLPEFIEQKRALAKKYKEAFSMLDGIKLLTEPTHSKSNYWLHALILDPEYAPLRDDILTETNEQGIMTRPAWALLHKLPMFCNSPKMDVSIAESIEQRMINIPSSPYLGANNV